MKKWMSAAALTAVLLCAAAPAARANGVEGLWMVENGKAVVELSPCNSDSLCGSIRWLRDDAKQYDYKNPDAEKRHVPLCGMKILWGFKRVGTGVWEDGSIYKADDGDTYHAEVRLNNDGTLHVRGHIGISFIGKSQTWKRVQPADYPRCTGPKGEYDDGATESAAPMRGVNE
jgi:uncharacterized protein (DUF2147 family)